MINKKHLKFYRVDNFKAFSAFLVPSTFTLAELINKIEQTKIYKDFQIFLQSELIELTEKTLKIQEIVKKKYIGKEQSPTFYICEFNLTPQIQTPQQLQYYEEVKQLLKLQIPTKTEWKGANGHIIFQGRNNSLMASSLKSCIKLHKQNKLNLNHILSESNTQPQSQLKNKIWSLKQKQSKQDIKEKQVQISKKYTNFDINFITSLQKTYLTYMLRSGFKLAYIEYRQWQFGIIEHRLQINDKIGIIGDYGTGLVDSYQLLENMVLKCDVNVIIHLGDVYYAGTPEEYQNNVGSFIKKLRVKSKKQILFYSIPGNHDYYSWGMPFLCFIKQINNEQFTKQKASYFCLRTQDNKWQFLGGDTAYHDSNPYDQINQINVGPRLRKNQLAWHKEKLQNFEGSTVFLTHHQLYSIHDRLCGSLSKYRCFSCINPILHQQLFEYMPYFSAWFWGHEHAFMLFKQNFWGVPLCRLLGNSSFHVIYDKQHPYERKHSFPKIPFITNDQTYLSKYLPLNPQKKNESYFNLCFGVIDLNKSKQNLLIEYYCSPSYTDKTVKFQYFKFYKLYEEIIKSKQNIIKNAQLLTNKHTFYLKNQIGLILDVNNNKLQLSLKGTPIRIYPIKQLQQVQDELPVYIVINEKDTQFFTSQNNTIILQNKPSSNSVWTLKKKSIMKDMSKTISTLNVFNIRNEEQMKYLGLTLSSGVDTPAITLSKTQGFWMLLSKQNVVV